MKKKFAFTMIEILIVFITIFACVKLASNIADSFSGKDKTVNILKDVQATISKSILFNETTDNGVTNWLWKGDSYNVAYGILTKYLLVDYENVTPCTNPLNCVGGYSSMDGEDYTNFRQEREYARFLINNEKTYIALKTVGTCERNQNTLCAIVVVDINNKDLPNKLGYDVFLFGVYSQAGFMPYGYNFKQEDIERNCSFDSTGETCAAKIMLDGWQMKAIKPNIYPIYEIKDWQFLN